MKKQNRAPRRKLRLEWAEESFGLPVEGQPPKAAPASISKTEFLRRHATCVGNPLLQLTPPEVTP